MVGKGWLRGVPQHCGTSFNCFFFSFSNVFLYILFNTNYSMVEAEVVLRHSQVASDSYPPPAEISTIIPRYDMGGKRVYLGQTVSLNCLVSRNKMLNSLLIYLPIYQYQLFKALLLLF